LRVRRALSIILTKKYAESTYFNEKDIWCNDELMDVDDDDAAESTPMSPSGVRGVEISQDSSRRDSIHSFHRPSVGAPSTPDATNRKSHLHTFNSNAWANGFVKFCEKMSSRCSKFKLYWTLYNLLVLIDGYRLAIHHGDFEAVVVIEKKFMTLYESHNHVKYIIYDTFLCLRRYFRSRKLNYTVAINASFFRRGRPGHGESEDNMQENGIRQCKEKIKKNVSSEHWDSCLQSNNLNGQYLDHVERLFRHVLGGNTNKVKDTRRSAIKQDIINLVELFNESGVFFCQ